MGLINTMFAKTDDNNNNNSQVDEKKQQFTNKQLSEFIFNAIELSEYGQKNMTYDNTRLQLDNNVPGPTNYLGRVYNWEMVRTAEQYLKQLLPESHIEFIKKDDINAYRVVGENETGDTYHMYLTINANKLESINPKNVLIVDVLYRNILMVHAGYTRKWTSKYGNYLFNTLPPIFVGTVQEMEDLIKDMKQRRQQDPEHANDILGNTFRWFEDPYANGTTQYIREK